MIKFIKFTLLWIENSKYISANKKSINLIIGIQVHIFITYNVFFAKDNLQILYNIIQILI